MLSEELGLQELLKGRKGCPCSGSARQLVPPTWNYECSCSSAGANSMKAMGLTSREN